MFQGIKESLAKKVLAKREGAKRTSKGSNFETVKYLGIIYIDAGIESYKEIKNYVQYLEGEHGIRNIQVLGYIDKPEKEYPEYLKTNVQYTFFTKSDLNWTLKPNDKIAAFKNQEFDILIDGTDGKSLPVSYAILDSKANMKVTRKSALYADKCDLIIDIHDDESTEEYL